MVMREHNISGFDIGFGSKLTATKNTLLEH